MDQTNWIAVIVVAIFAVSIFHGYRKGFFRLCVSFTVTILTVILVVILTPYAGDAIVRWTEIDEVIRETCMEALVPEEIAEAETVSLQEQINMIEHAELPEFFRKMLVENNNSEVYAMLGVERFADYIASSVARITINVMAFLVTFIVITIVVRMTLFTLDVVTKIPVVRGMNRWAGAGLGIVMGMILVWIFFMSITLFGHTPFGTECFRQIQSSRFLSELYQMNMILKGIVF